MTASFLKTMFPLEDIGRRKLLTFNVFTGSSTRIVYNADYDHETVKLRKARELKEKGSGIEILTTEEWKKLIDS